MITLTKPGGGAELQSEFDESVGCWIALTAHTMRRALDAELAREKITFRQWEVLGWISMCEELSQAELADRLGIEAPTLAGILARMERDGWLERTTSPNDRRCKLIRMTDKVEPIWSRTLECCRRVRARATDGISDEQLQTLKTTCDRIRQNLSTPAEQVVECSGQAAVP